MGFGRFVWLLVGSVSVLVGRGFGGFCEDFVRFWWVVMFFGVFCESFSWFLRVLEGLCGYWWVL